MEPVFKKLGLAITFSPNGYALLKEVKRLKYLFNSELALIHVGKRSPELEEQLSTIISKAGLTLEDADIIWAEGDPADAILKSSKSAGVDLLVAGALEKENLFKYYLGSVARKIMREADSTVLILKNPSREPKGFKSYFVSTEYTEAGEKTVKTAYQFALLENALNFVLIKDFHVPGLASTVLDSGEMSRIEAQRAEWQKEEEEKLKLFANEMNLKELNVKCVCLYGKEGWEESNYARQNNADIFAVTAPSKRAKLLDKLFPREEEYAFENLPSNLLIVR